MSKPPARQVPSDDYTVVVEGEVYHPHEGEYVSLVGNPTIGELEGWDEFRRMAVEFDAIKGEPDEREKVGALLETTTRHLCALLARRIVGWTWTDDRGRPLVAPALDDPDDETQVVDATGLLKALTTDELYYLLRISRGEAPAERKNGTSSSPTSSSDTAPTPTRTRRGTAPNHTTG